MYLKIWSAKWQPFCPGGDELTHCGLVTPYGSRHQGQHCSGNVGLFLVRKKTITSTNANSTNWTLKNIFQWDIIWNSKVFNYENAFEMSSAKCSPFWPSLNVLTHWVRVTHICVSKLTIIGSDNDLSPGRRQAIIWINAGILLIGSLETNFSEILIQILTSSFKKMHLKILSAKWRQFCLGLNVLKEKE